MIKCIIFDLGGVVVDYSDKRDYAPYLSRLSGVAMREVVKIFDSNELNLLETGKMSQSRFTGFIAKRLSIPKSKVMFVQKRRSRARLDMGVVDIARRASRHYAVAYLTNESKGRYADVRRMLRSLDKTFRHRFASCYLGLSKPGAAVYVHVLSTMGLRAGEALFIDNSADNVAGARRVGIKSILFTNAKDLEKELKRMGIRL